MPGCIYSPSSTSGCPAISACSSSSVETGHFRERFEFSLANYGVYLLGQITNLRKTAGVSERGGFLNACRLVEMAGIEPAPSRSRQKSTTSLVSDLSLAVRSPTERIPTGWPELSWTARSRLISPTHPGITTPTPQDSPLKTRQKPHQTRVAGQGSRLLHSFGGFLQVAGLV